MDHTGSRGAIKKVAPTTGLRTLGIRLAPDGNNCDELQYLTDKANLWKDRIRNGTLPRHLVWESLTTGILSTLSYPLLATTFTHSECASILRPVLWAGLPKAGIVRTMSRAIVHGPVAQGGLGIPNLFYVQLRKHLERLLRYGYQANHITGFLDRISLEQTTLELGLPDHPFQHNHAQWRGNLTKTWITRTWEDMQSVNMELFPTTPTIPTLRDRDVFLMAQFYSSGIREPSTLAVLNEVRMFLFAVTLADIVTADGASILDSAWTTKNHCGRRSHYNWPKTVSPTPRHIQIWQEALVSAFGVDRRFRRLTSTLGNWEEHIITTHWLFSPSTDRLLLR
jgi:hypothetical protein